MDDGNEVDDDVADGFVFACVLQVVFDYHYILLGTYLTNNPLCNVNTQRVWFIAN